MSKVLTTVGDLTDETLRSQLVTQTVDTFGQLDVLVSAPLCALDSASWTQVSR